MFVSIFFAFLSPIVTYVFNVSSVVTVVVVVVVFCVIKAPHSFLTYLLVVFFCCCFLDKCFRALLGMVLLFIPGSLFFRACKVTSLVIVFSHCLRMALGDI